MNKLTGAISQDVRIILKHAHDSVRTSESVKKDRDNTVKKLQKDIKSKISEINILKDSNAELKQKITKGEYLIL